MSPRPKSRRRHEKTTVLIVGEGRQTEPNYFDGLKRTDAVHERFAVTIKKGHGSSAEESVKEALSFKKKGLPGGEPYDQVWCVIDVEAQENYDSVERAITLADKKNITLCLSNPSFEVWFLAHFARTSKSLLSPAAAIKELKKVWRNHLGIDYEKNDRQVYHRIADRTETAVKNAQQVRETDHRGKTIIEANSSTEVYKLVKRLLGQ